MSMNGGPPMGQYDWGQLEVASNRAARGAWNGKGDAPSKEAAIEWARSRGVPSSRLTSLSGSKRSMATTVRRLVADHGAAARQADRKTEGQRRNTPAAGSVAEVDANDDGSIADDLLAGLDAPGKGSSRGAALWPYQAADETLAGITVENRSKLPDNANPFQKKPSRIGARYFEADTLAPLRWSQEQRADLQRVMHSIGLYGDKKIRLGSWGAQDQAVFAELLAASNVAGTRWVETLEGWRKNPPVELLDEIRGEQPKRPTIQVTNPIDIRQAGQVVSQQLTGAVDRGFTEGLVKPYQGVEAAAQSAVYSDQDAGGGGTTTQAPSMAAFAEDKLRREKPLEVDGYQFLAQFDEFLSMLGVS